MTGYELIFGFTNILKVYILKKWIEDRNDGVNIIKYTLTEFFDFFITVIKYKNIILYLHNAIIYLSCLQMQGL